MSLPLSPPLSHIVHMSDFKERLTEHLTSCRLVYPEHERKKLEPKIDSYKTLIKLWTHHFPVDCGMATLMLFQLTCYSEDFIKIFQEVDKDKNYNDNCFHISTIGILEENIAYRTLPRIPQEDESLRPKIVYFKNIPFNDKKDIIYKLGISSNNYGYWSICLPTPEHIPEELKLCELEDEVECYLIFLGREEESHPYNWGLASKDFIQNKLIEDSLKDLEKYKEKDEIDIFMEKMEKKWEKIGYQDPFGNLRPPMSWNPGEKWPRGIHEIPENEYLNILSSY